MTNILVVDDSTSMRNMVSATLSSAGYQVKEAPDGKAALGVAKSMKFDAVITDLNMPVMNGLDLVRNLRALPSFKYTPILLLTTESSSDKKNEGKQAGATGWLVKPFNPEKLLATVGRVIG
ncbi:response regulator [Marinibactrum halimedae]|uniref:Fis family transcriptional regulator n=1 Tax=Marinibactrum halimedae TaxID=1444977 RepID=A0AA37T168_9GAMM|nr:response regulator [Marinibactrum halimedae]MCD9460308.1 response regulator [Marinibactrum halimedae]GLS24398.1 Fis family transcriptional regulator [Marinibactrum halimedae]